MLDGTKAQRVRYLPRLAKGEILASFALTEPNAGSDAANISTMAERRGDGFIVNGTKHFITNASISDLFIVMAVTDERLRARGGITAFLVEKDTPGVTIGSIQRAMGWRGIHEGEVILQDVSLPEDNVIGEVGQGLIAALKTVDEGKLGVSSMSVGMADRLLELSIEYAQKGSRSGRQLSEGQSIQWLLADMAMEIHASRLILYTTAAKLDRGERVRLEAAMTKVYTAEMVGRVVDSAFEIFGSEGYVKGSAVERICRDARVFRIVDGTSEIQRIVMGRELLKGSRIAY